MENNLKARAVGGEHLWSGPLEKWAFLGSSVDMLLACRN